MTPETVAQDALMAVADGAPVPVATVIEVTKIALTAELEVVAYGQAVERAVGSAFVELEFDAVVGRIVGGFEGELVGSF